MTSAAVASLYDAVELNARLFLNCLRDVPEEIARRRPNERTNNIAFIALHITDTRYMIANFIGAPLKNPFSELLREVKSVEDIPNPPDLKTIERAWQEISAHLAAAIRELREEDLCKESHERFPSGDESLLGGVTFLLHHESYHIGQLGILRKFFGLEAMRYS